MVKRTQTTDYRLPFRLWFGFFMVSCCLFVLYLFFFLNNWRINHWLMKSTVMVKRGDSQNTAVCFALFPRIVFYETRPLRNTFCMMDTGGLMKRCRRRKPVLRNGGALKGRYKSRPPVRRRRRRADPDPITQLPQSHCMQTCPQWARVELRSCWHSGGTGWVTGGRLAPNSDSCRS